MPWPLYVLRKSHCIGWAGWAGCRAGLDTCDKRKVAYPCQKIKPLFLE